MKSLVFILLLPCLVADPLRFVPRRPTADWSSQDVNVTSTSRHVVNVTRGEPVVCPGHHRFCSDGQTCCKAREHDKHEQYSCCPMPKAVCCKDYRHCCPHGYRCDLKHGSCMKDELSVPVTRTEVALKKEVATVQCPGSAYQCPDGNTCCKLHSGNWGCCPLPSAVCCPNGVNCCPHGYTCGDSGCSKGSETVPFSYKTLAVATVAQERPLEGLSRLFPELESVRCKDGNLCPIKTTCCKLTSGKYGCCPLESATCCKDGVHCCPKTYVCDDQRAECRKGLETIPWVRKTESSKPSSHPIELADSGVLCPDRTTCPDGSTCCKSIYPGYSCCPVPNAVCCNDGLHCCRYGYTCDLKRHTCTKRENGVLTEAPLIPKHRTVKNIICPDDVTQCSSMDTCCLLDNEEWGCCPLPRAVCCLDHVHCCAEGYKCDLSHQTCDNGYRTLPMVKKVRGIRRSDTRLKFGSESSLKSVICPDHESECADGQTCCMTPQGAYACCPFAKAICCNDGLHCCPGGYKCDLKAGTCTRPGSLPSLPAAMDLIREPVKTNGAGAVICPDGQSQCPDGNTCCKLASGGYGCCPLPKATCCQDHVHCCPNGYTCGTGTCNKGLEQIPFYRKTEASEVQSETKPVPNVVCPGRQSQCPDGSTCCQLASGGYACCPLPKATCCKDHVHCCPNGYTCDTGAGTCNRGLDRIPFYTKTEASQVQSETKPVPNVVCPGRQSQCPDGSTCCQLASGGYACCPLPKATCCKDHVHCCPNGYTCDTGAGTCNRGLDRIPFYTKTEASQVQFETEPVPNVVCPDGQSQCPDGNTCCKTDSGEYGCCPLPKAACCQDHVHCCPNGYTCDTGAGTCNRGLDRIPFYTKTEAIRSDQDQSKVQAEIRPVTIRPVTSTICPDGQSQCPDGNTCCQLVSGGYACCPLPKATCCNDHVHCCPNGYTCDTGAGTCNRGLERIPFFRKNQASEIQAETKPVPNVVCPDGQSQCPDGNTCCQLVSGGYACCPLPKATCCNDHVHCCPNGYTCDAGTCNRGLEQIPFYTKTEASKVQAETEPVPNVVCPDGRSQCPDGNTCCKTDSGEYGCCPLPMAACCQDHVHCCPNGYTCDTGAGTCNMGLERIPFYRKNQASEIQAETKPVPNVVCPDGQSQCPDGNTCCQLVSGGYACCPLPKATCCKDHVHCCPNGYTCDTGAGSCNKGFEQIPFYTKTTASKVQPDIKTLTSVTCPDRQSQCPDGNTCCQLASGGYGCCPLPMAACCQDHVHCCPNGYTCGTGTCNKGLEQIPFYSKTEASKVKAETKPVPNVVCPDGQSQCPDGNTCCKTDSGEYGCCPLPMAACCQDHVHCCPNGYTCDTGAGTCNRGLDRIPFYTKTEAIRSDQDQSKVRAEMRPVTSTVCPDGQSQCPDGNTCCQLVSGGYACCPLPKATCCKDHVHCCPNGYTCDTGAGTCNRGLERIPFFRKNQASEIQAETKPVPNVVCPDGRSQCPDGNTCCQLVSGGYACCPLPKATCCKDHVHCCPSGYTCDTGAGSCNKGFEQIPFYTKTTASKFQPDTKTLTSVTCPDRQSQCPDGNTCCQLASGGYGCCPLPMAACCQDDVHCCPNGYTCGTGTCNRGLEQIPFYTKTEASKVQAETEPVPNVVCPDGRSQCPDGNTCCQLSSGGYACCPLPKATCCQDHVHCCPNGYTCGTGTCNKGLEQIPFYRKTEVSQVQSETKLVPNVVCPDGRSQCPDGSTCCQLASGGYGCCPTPKAACCQDHVHCCPNGYTCDTGAGTCNRGLDRIPFYTKTEASQIQSEIRPVTSTVCPDRQSQCPDGSTCCQLASGGYGCCPLPKATCCQDHLHCCPNGYTCGTGTCNKGLEQIPFYRKTEASQVQSETKPVPNVVCPDGGSQCPDGNTCCQLVSGGYACCPLPKATCCKDHVHCCPNGYTCDVSAGSCNQGLERIPFYTKTTASKFQPDIKTLTSVTCPDGQSQCPDGNTCCKLASGEYGCCPLPKATCCQDHVHCCPNGYTCGTSTCNRGLEQIPFYTKTEASQIQSEIGPVTSTVCPDRQSQCPDGSTCCKLASGEYGCCPLRKATCCQDHVHCCPNGYTCGAGTCNKGLEQIPFYTKTNSQKKLSRKKMMKNLVGTSSLQLEVLCPGKRVSCPTSTTCCQMSDGQYGCCPMRNAVCCPDHLHCCPETYTCNVAKGTCQKGKSTLPWQRKVVAMPVISTQKCKDGGSCPDDYTCCPIGKDVYGCCTYSQAACCPDMKHCCPHGTTCVGQGATLKCKPSPAQLVSSFIQRIRPLNAQPRLLIVNKPRPVVERKPLIGQKKITCPDGRSWCNDWETCCSIGQVGYGCCPYSKGVCCADHLHCCPSGYNCTDSQCVKGALQLPLGVPRLADVPAELPEFREPSVAAIDCGKGVTCPEGTTCCDMITGEPGCCPVPNASCCEDKLHCCAEGLVCDKAGTKCSKPDGSLTIAALSKFPAKKSDNTFP